MQDITNQTGYRSQPAATPEMQWLLVSERMADIVEKVKGLPELDRKIDGIVFDIKKLSSDHSQTRNDLDQARTAWQAEVKIVKSELEPLKESKAMVDTLKGQFRVAGVTLFLAACGGWFNMNHRINENSTRATIAEQKQEANVLALENIMAQIVDANTQNKAWQSEVIKRQESIQMDLYRAGKYNEDKR